jgi:hypothetical protein
MAGKIFISYRRDDDASAAARVSDGLASRFGKANLFIDVDNLLAGQRFDEELAKALTACDVLIAVIGRRWMDLLKAKTTSGERDYVREEIAAALQRRIVVVPVRVGLEGQLLPLPRAEDLPVDIRDLVLYQKQDVTYERFGRDIGELIEAITVVRLKAYSRRWIGWGLAAAVVLSGGMASWYYYLQPSAEVVRAARVVCTRLAAGESGFSLGDLKVSVKVSVEGDHAELSEEANGLYRGIGSIVKSDFQDTDACLGQAVDLIDKSLLSG